MWYLAAAEAVHEDTSNDDCVRGYEGGIHNGNNDIESQRTADVDQGDYNRNCPGEDDRVERNVLRKIILQKLADIRGRERTRTGAKKWENGTPPLRAKAQNCRDAAARAAMQPAV